MDNSGDVSEEDKKKAQANAYQTIFHRVLGFAIAGGIVVALADTRAAPMATAIVVFALLYSLVEGGGVSALTTLSNAMKGAAKG